MNATRCIPLCLALAALLGLACELDEARTPTPDFAAENAVEEIDDDERTPGDLPDDGAEGLPSEAVELAELELDPEDNQACVDCHPDQAASWEGSLHQRAWVEPAFQDSYGREPLEFCRGCHAPRADPRAEPPAALAKLGVDCVSCHVREGVVHSGPAATATPAPHALVRSPDFGEASCASCHEFEFPRKAHRAPGTLMQKTLREHEGSEWSALDCADCHFPARDDGRGRDHGLAISRDPELLRASLSARVERVDPETVRFELAPIGVGHRFPTGDLFRRLELRAEARDQHGQILETSRRYLARHFESELDGHGTIGEARDDRLAGPATIELTLARGSEAASVRWSVSYERVGSRDHAHPERSKLAGAVRLAEGVLPASD